MTLLIMIMSDDNEEADPKKKVQKILVVMKLVNTMITIIANGHHKVIMTMIDVRQELW